MKRFDIQDYVEANLDKVRPVNSSDGHRELTAMCPSCGAFGRFYLNADSGRFTCFKCEFSGRNVAALIAHVEGCSYSEAQSYVFRNSVPLARKKPLIGLLDSIRLLRDREVAETVEVEAELPDGFIPCYDPRTKRWSLPVYLKERGIKSATARKWKLGHVRRGRYGGRLVIPFECPAGSSWTARDMTGEQEPKYLNPDGADHARLLIGWNTAHFGGDLVLCEGPTDAIKLQQAEVCALAFGGKVLHEDQLSTLVDHFDKDQAVVLMLDPEEETAPYDAARELSCHFSQIYIAKLPDGTDPGSASRKQIHRALLVAKKWDGGRAQRLRGILSRSKKAIISRT